MVKFGQNLALCSSYIGKFEQDRPETVAFMEQLIKENIDIHSNT